MLICPLKLGGFLGELSQWFGDITETWNEFGTMSDHTEETLHFTN